MSLEGDTPASIGTFPDGLSVEREVPSLGPPMGFRGTRDKTFLSVGIAVLRLVP